MITTLHNILKITIMPVLFLIASIHQCAATDDEQNARELTAKKRAALHILIDKHGELPAEGLLQILDATVNCKFKTVVDYKHIGPKKIKTFKALRKRCVPAIRGRSI